MRVSFVPLALALLAPSSALASTWSDYDHLFPTFPCADGWVGCLVDGKRISPEPARVGRAPVSSDARINFLTLSPTAAFNPFVGLSDYAIEPADRGRPQPEKVAVIAPIPAPEIGSTSPPRVPKSPPQPPKTPALGHIDPLPERLSPTLLRPKAPEAQTETETAEVDVHEKDEEVEVVELPPELPKLPEVEEVIPDLSEQVDLALADRGAVTCDDLRALEPAAMMGRLGVDQRACLEASLEATAVQTKKKAVSLMLIQNAWTSDKQAWGTLVKRHLEVIDQSDPNLCYKYAQHLYKQRSHAATIRWAEVALENKTRWSGETYTSRVYDLHKLKAAAQQSMWMAAEERHKTAPSAETDAAREKARTATKVYARQWLDYARSASKDTTKAMQVCTSAAGTEAYCE